MSSDQSLSLFFRIIFGVVTGFVLFAPLFLILFRDFQRRPRDNNPSRISSFFELQEFVQTVNLRGYAKLYSALVCGVLLLAYVAMFLSDKISDTALKAINLALEDSALGAVSAAISNSGVGAPVSLFTLTIIGTVVCFPYLAKVNNLLKLSAQSGIDFDDTCNALVGIAASDVRKAGKISAYLYSESETKDVNTGVVVKVREPMPVPREFGEDPDEETVLRYILLKGAIQDAPERGLIPSLKDLLLEHNVISSFEDPPDPINIKQLVVLSLFFVAMSLVYCGLIGKIGNLACGSENCKAEFLGEFAFAGATKNEPDKVFAGTIIDYLIFAAQVALPFWIGIALYDRKRLSSSNKFDFKSNFIPVAFMQITWSFFLSLLSIGAIYVYSWINPPMIAVFTSWNLLQFTISVLLAPIITVLWVWLSVRPMPRLFQPLAAALVAGLVYGFMGFCYTCLLQTIKSRAVQDFNPSDYPQQDVYWAVLAVYVVLVCGILWLTTSGKPTDNNAATVGSLDDLKT